MINTTRTIQGFPHCGRVFLCEDTVGIIDAWQLHDAYTFALANGVSFVNETAHQVNFGNWWSGLNQSAAILTQPLAGFEGNIATFVGIGAASTNAVGVIHPNLDSYALSLSFRFLTQSEYAAFTPQNNASNWTGIGYECQRITITLVNDAIAAPGGTLVLADIFVNIQRYQQWVDPSVSIQSWTIDLTTNPQGLTVGDINNIVALGQITPAMRRAFECQAHLSMRYEFRVQPNGGLVSGAGSWNSIAFLPIYLGVKRAVANFDEVLNPLTGVYSGGVGILQTQLTTYFTGANQTQTGTAATATPTNSAGVRTVALMPSTAAATMGDNNSAALWADLRNKALGAFGACWPILSICGRNFGGSFKPILGNAALYDDSVLETMTVPVQIPQGVTGFTVVMYLKTTLASLVGVHSVTVTLSNTTNAQVLYQLTNNAAPTVARYKHAIGNLNTGLLPVSGQVEAYQLEIRVSKTVFRTGVQSITDWDGLGALFVGVWS